jgi:hypothetical protein
MNENQKKTSEEYRSNYDNIFKKKQDDKPKTKDFETFARLLQKYLERDYK